MPERIELVDTRSKLPPWGKLMVMVPTLFLAGSGLYSVLGVIVPCGLKRQLGRLGADQLHAGIGEYGHLVEVVDHARTSIKLDSWVMYWSR